MIEETTHVSDRALIESHAKLYGGYNDLPPNMKEITEEEFVRSNFSMHTRLREFRQPSQYRNSNEEFERLSLRPMTNLYLYFIPGNQGYTIVNDSIKNKLRFFTFAVCIHDIESTRVSMHLRKYTCKKCGWTYVTDSSD